MRASIPECLNVQAWRTPSLKELREYHDSLGVKRRRSRKKRNDLLTIRSKISPLDMYCYLRARFGKPNGISTLVLNKNTADNYIHWDFHIVCGTQSIYIMGFTKEMQFKLSENITDDNWRALIQNIKTDFGRVSPQKSEFLKTLEKWAVFPNKYRQIVDICADLHSSITDEINAKSSFKVTNYKKKSEIDNQFEELEQVRKRAVAIHGKCLQLSLLTPVMAEAFINMIILMLCKREIRDNQRQFDSFVRQNIDTKVFDLSFKCNGFTKTIQQQSENFQNFKKVMDKRNHAIHGNISPEREVIEWVYFEKFTPLYKEPGDLIGDFVDAIERQYKPTEVVQDYVNMHLFFEEIIDSLDSKTADSARVILEDPYPGYDVGRKVIGNLFPERKVAGYYPDVRYDDELFDEA